LGESAGEELAASTWPLCGWL